MEKAFFYLFLLFFCLVLMLIFIAIVIFGWVIHMKKLFDKTLKDCWDLHDDINIMHYEITQVYEKVTGETWIVRPVMGGEKK